MKGGAGLLALLALLVAAPAAAGPLDATVRFFQRYIYPVDGPRCRMYPTCSAYALQAIDKHGPLVGGIMAVDRLLHESDPGEHRHPVRLGGRIRFHDPVEDNDFWFAER